MTTVYDPKKYGKLLIDVSPGAIETEEENERALAVIDRLMSKPENALSPEEDRLLRMLAVLVEDFENRAYPMGESNSASNKPTCSTSSAPKAPSPKLSTANARSANRRRENSRSGFDYRSIFLSRSPQQPHGG